MGGSKADEMKRMLSEVLAPLLEVDGGELYLVSATKKEVKLHLAGSWGGSPGAPLASQRIVQPAVLAIQPKAKVTVSTGWSIPKGATRVEAKKS